MNCTPQPTDTPGIFRCPRCGLQNPRPIPKPFIAVCRKPEPPIEYTPNDVQFILGVICPSCKHETDGLCRYKPEGGCPHVKREPQSIADMIRNPNGRCPIARW